MIPLIIRSRDPEVLSTCDIVVDVGAVYDHEKKRYDHHQRYKFRQNSIFKFIKTYLNFFHHREFKETLGSLRPELYYEIKLSSAGLVYCHYGEQILQDMIGKKNDALLKILYKKVYENFIMEIDAIDNGVNICDGEPR